MAPITVTVDVERPAPDVFAYAVDPARFHEWQRGVTGGRMDRPGVPAVGAHCLTTRRIGGAERSSTSEVVHVDPRQVRS
ncbi:SRPBCC family protein [Dactylosporangium sp. McL0621]|uniref:SRPBCC family protein n=1 Tax=Dactylosporangium sp. McL0621 TaxID=3415678 RepID=UPI003CE68B74